MFVVQENGIIIVGSGDDAAAALQASILDGGSSSSITGKTTNSSRGRSSSSSYSSSNGAGGDPATDKITTPSGGVPSVAVLEVRANRLQSFSSIMDRISPDREAVKLAAVTAATDKVRLELRLQSALLLTRLGMVRAEEADKVRVSTRLLASYLNKVSLLKLFVNE